MEQRGWGDRDRIRADRRLDRGRRDQRVSVGRNQPHVDLQQRRLEALTIGDFGRFSHHARHHRAWFPRTIKPELTEPAPASGGFSVLPPSRVQPTELYKCRSCPKPPGERSVVLTKKRRR